MGGKHTNSQRGSRQQGARAPELVLLGLGTLFALVLLTDGLKVAQAERQATKIAAPVQTGTTGPARAAETIVPNGTFGATYSAGSDGKERPAEVIGQIRMPALSLAAPVIAGITEADLLRGAGHVPGSGYAGGLGNMAIAGHRDTFFRPLRRVTPGMLILVSSPSGTFRYEVDRTEVVSPEQLRVLDIGDRPQLTLITCFPFNYIGAAPSRFIVFAHLLSAAPEAGNG